tara:strand:- start:1316 stop:2062 length:747 start_codon:yes stop_codon:yes gene_type:complete
LKNYGLIGYPLSHSFSKKFFENKFANENINANYVNYELESIELFPKLFNRISLSGLNVTIPYKKAVLPYLDELDDVSLSIGAVNTIVPLLKNGRWFLKGFNTDVYGFRQSIRSLLKNHHQKALIFGTGGASKAVAYVLNQYGITVNFISRSQLGPNVFSWDKMNDNLIEQHGILVNTTPVGMFPKLNECLPIPFNHVGANHLVIDLIYNPEETLFLKNCKSKGAQVLNGHRMLTCQALKSWEIWNQLE